MALNGETIIMVEAIEDCSYTIKLFSPKRGVIKQKVEPNINPFKSDKGYFIFLKSSQKAYFSLTSNGHENRNNMKLIKAISQVTKGEIIFRAFSI